MEIIQPYLLNLTLKALQADEDSLTSFPFHEIAPAIPSVVYILPSSIHSTISLAVAFVGQPMRISHLPASKSHQLAYFYAIVAFITQITKSQCSLQHLYYSRRAATRILGELTGSIYEKALVRTDITGVVASDQKTQSKKDAEGKDVKDQAVASADVGKIVSLIATDANQCANVMNMLTVR